jgi:hypothetical protein
MAMERRVFGRTGMRLSVLGFGCGAVGGLMVRGDPLDQERTIARAIAAGVSYFDTAVQYGSGQSEKNLGRVLHNLKASDVVVGTKVRLPSAEFDRIKDAVATSLEGSLARLHRGSAPDCRPHLIRESNAEVGSNSSKQLQTAISVREPSRDAIFAYCPKKDHLRDNS